MFHHPLCFWRRMIRFNCYRHLLSRGQILVVSPDRKESVQATVVRIVTEQSFKYIFFPKKTRHFLPPAGASVLFPYERFALQKRFKSRPKLLKLINEKNSNTCFHANGRPHLFRTFSCLRLSSSRQSDAKLSAFQRRTGPAWPDRPLISRAISPQP